MDFIRTQRHRGTGHEVEDLPDGPALAAWVALCGPVAPMPGCVVPSPIVQDARVLREAVYDLLSTARAGRPLSSAPPSARDRVNAAAARTIPVPGLDDRGDLRWYANDAVTGTLALVARDALDLVTSPMLDRVRECADPDCNALFLDASRPGSRRWCSMDACGNRAKKQRRRAISS
ncbi:CGNR zinc finger domain-containing protein [Dactylosporangium sp. CA-092794]|uniref:CGNR zinc finger domain-containing protein n=1 Tax=Dactylosporangium sp. CA-092794 TaxID=3239929 RepID=UPI003D8FF629